MCLDSKIRFIQLKFELEFCIHFQSAFWLTHFSGTDFHVVSTGRHEVVPNLNLGKRKNSDDPYLVNKVIGPWYLLSFNHKSFHNDGLFRRICSLKRCIILKQYFFYLPCDLRLRFPSAQYPESQRKQLTRLWLLIGFGVVFSVLVQLKAATTKLVD